MSIVPKEMDDKEKLVRSVFHPINFKKDKTLNKNIFTSPPNKDEVSVNRSNDTNTDFIKKISKHIADPASRKKYKGLAVIDVSEVRAVGAKVVHGPMAINETLHNPYHADIKIGIIKEKGQPLPQEYAYKINQMTEKCRYYQDPNPQEDKWTGNKLI